MATTSLMNPGEEVSPTTVCRNDGTYAHLSLCIRFQWKVVSNTTRRLAESPWVVANAIPEEFTVDSTTPLGPMRWSRAHGIPSGNEKSTISVNARLLRGICRLTEPFRSIRLGCESLKKPSPVNAHEIDLPSTTVPTFDLEWNGSSGSRLVSAALLTRPTSDYRSMGARILLHQKNSKPNKPK